MFPVEERLRDISSALARNRNVVLTAPPGSGKTTCVAPALLDEPWLGGRKIVMLEPRRLAAMSCARYMASRLGEDAGGTIGYQVRLERRIGPRTRLEILTEGLLAQRLLSDPELSGVGLVVFDEFHERSLSCDLGFALVIEARRAFRNDLRLLVMSATLDAGEVAAHLGDADVVNASGRMFPVDTRYLGDVSVPAAVSRALKETEGDVLCFLPGEGEIRRAAEGIGEPAGCEVLPLYGSLPKEQQGRVFERSRNRKIILSTSIAETSVTIPGITCVVDCGLMRTSRFSPVTGMSGRVTLPLSMDRAEQRRGRAGRVAPGVCYRLWREGENMHRLQRMPPEMLDADLCSLVLSSVAWGAPRRDDLPWLTPQPVSAWNQAVSLLRLLGALDDAGRLTEKGGRMASMAMHPRLASMMLDAGGGDAAMLAAILEEGVRFDEADIRKALDEIRETPSRPASKRIMRLASRFASRGGTARRRMSEGAMLALAYPDRIARNRGNGTFRMVSGRGAFIDQSDPLSKAPYAVCCELDDRPGDARVFLACPIDESEIEEMFGGQMAEEESCAWDRRSDSVKAVVARRLGHMTLGERPLSSCDPGKVAECMMEGIRTKGVDSLPCWTEEAVAMRERMRFMHSLFPGKWPDPDDKAVASAMEGFIAGISKWRDLDRVDLRRVLDFVLSQAGLSSRELDRLAPTHVAMPSGARRRVRYGGAEPTVEVRLQECFGMAATPRIVDGTVPVVMTLLSPANRPIQITKDLAGFWKEGYGLVRKEMRGRYPRHRWPENPV